MYLNLNRAAWRRIAGNGALQGGMALWGRRNLAATCFSLAEKCQQSVVGVDAPVRDDPLIILGYWRSGTTLLHEYLAMDPSLRAPTTHACMNPHHFVFMQAGVRGKQVRRPMDDMMVKSASPGEEEFALLGLGAPSPYEALLFPERLEHVLMAADPDDLTMECRLNWERALWRFLQAVHYVEGAHQLVLKSPTHGFRVPMLARLFPGARFILLVRDPMTNFESVVRMWHSLGERYALAPLLSDDALREIILVNRLRFEEKLWRGLQDIAPGRHVLLRYEDLVRDPETQLKTLYQSLNLEGFEQAVPAFRNQVIAASSYRPAAVLPQGRWQKRVSEVWRPIVTRYGYA